MTKSRDERDRLVVELIREAEELEWALRLANGWTPTPAMPDVPEFARYLLSLPPAVAGESSHDVLVRFAILYKEELAIVRAARNRVAHALDLEFDTLSTATQVARTLVQLLHRNVGRTGDIEQAGPFTKQETEALELAATANGWSAAQVRELRSVAVALKASTTALVSLDSVDGWVKLAAVTTDVAVAATA